MEQVPYPKTYIRGIITNDTNDPKAPTAVPSVRMRLWNGVALKRRPDFLMLNREARSNSLLPGAEGILIDHPLLLRRVVHPFVFDFLILSSDAKNFQRFA